MHHIGHKLQVPKRDDDGAWVEFEKQLAAPGYEVFVGSEEMKRENEHFEGCKVRRKDEKCGRCRRVWERLPGRETERWGMV
jgi:hypothetical protein